MTANITPESLAELWRLLDAANAERVMSTSLEMDYSLMRKSTRALFVAAVDALPDLLDAAAERDRLREMVRSFGRTIDRWGKLIIAATASEDITTPDGDGDWQVIEERLAEVPALLAERDALAATLEETEGRLSSLLCDLTGGLLSKPTYPMATMAQAIEEHLGKYYESDLKSERDALAAKVEAVREWIDRRGVDVSDRDGDYMDGYRAAQRHAVQDAAKLRRALDEEPQP